MEVISNMLDKSEDIYISFKKNFIFCRKMLGDGEKPVKHRVGIVESFFISFLIPLAYELVVVFLYEDSGTLFRLAIMTPLLFVLLNLRYLFLIKKFNKKFRDLIDS